jgi:hypothetical protein
MEYLAKMLMLAVLLTVWIGGAVTLIVALPTLIESQFRNDGEKFF